jgi:nitrogen fixation protein FixH
MRAAKLWPLAVVAVLAVTVGANVVIYLLARDPGAAVVERDYYRRAVAWDSTMADERRSAELGWRLAAELGAVGADGAPLTVRLTGRDGAPLSDAAVRVEAVHNLDAGHPVAAALAPAGDGRYVARLPLRHAGLWELRFAVTRGAERFTQSLRREAALGEGARGR